MSNLKPIDTRGYTLPAFENTAEDRQLLIYILTELIDVTRARFLPLEKANELAQFENENGIVQQTLDYIDAHWTEKPGNAWAFQIDGAATLKRDVAQIHISSQHYFVTNTTRWVECAACHTVGIASKLLPAFVIAPCDCHYPPRYTVHSPRLVAACRT